MEQTPSEADSCSSVKELQAFYGIRISLPYSQQQGTATVLRQSNSVHSLKPSAL